MVTILIFVLRFVVGNNSLMWDTGPVQYLGYPSLPFLGNTPQIIQKRRMNSWVGRVLTTHARIQTLAHINEKVCYPKHHENTSTNAVFLQLVNFEICNKG